jgi:hypothetical protein
MRCLKWAVEISKWHEGELSDEGTANLLRHLENCRSCQGLEKKLRAVSALLNESPELPVPDFLSQRINASVPERVRKHTAGRFSGLTGLLLYRHGALVTTGILAIGLCIGCLAGHNIAGYTKVIPDTPSYDLLTLGGIGAESQPVVFNPIWQDNGEGVRP